MYDLKKIDFQSVKMIVFDFDGVFTDNKVIVSQNGHESVVCSRFDGIGLSLLREAGIGSIIMSSETNPVVSARAAKLNIDCLQAVNDKSEAIKHLAVSRNIKLSEIAFLGNDVNDIPALSIVGFPIGVVDCWPDIKKHCLALTSRPGGFGAVRELCEAVVLQR